MTRKVLSSESVLPVRDALMEGVTTAVRDGHGQALSAYLAALDQVGYSSTRPVTISVDLHGWALLNALIRRARSGREILEGALSEDERHAGYARQLQAETAVELLGLDGESCLPPAQRLSARPRSIGRRR
jgi:hypothetical protein